ncbi:Bax inhibitor-1 family protein [Basilea psittacipulmonis]|uniref:BAX inhibitor protein n=1 Tax=Basilea psittacipulmonis DSM 24701 TaxID=1072685 RepID=A0A077DDT3_9BURK|nr:Bax inhibitor-1 family protein [Basilea psittacipulmonis]AIL33030.1 hypothetical protein IX83_06630 [Basilea psittacipulmonis DSM 24701]
MSAFEPNYSPTVSAGSMNKVLRNTLWMLALSLLPTVVGAAVAIHFQLYYYMTGIMFVIVFFASMFGLFYLINANKDNALGVVFLLLFTFIEGVMLSGALASVQTLPNGGEIILLASSGTFAIFIVMSLIATVTKKDLSSWTSFLTIGVVLLIVMAIANMFLHMSALSLAISAIALLVFSAFLLIDMQRVIRGGETNYVMATLSIYLDLINIFLALLNILSALNRR